MNEMKLSLTKDQEQLIKSIATSKVYHPENGEFYFIPFWFENIGEGKYELHKLGSLPDGLKDMIKQIREPMNIGVFPEGLDNRLYPETP